MHVNVCERERARVSVCNRECIHTRRDGIIYWRNHTYKLYALCIYAGRQARHRHTFDAQAGTGPQQPRGIAWPCMICCVVYIYSPVYLAGVFAAVSMSMQTALLPGYGIGAPRYRLVGTKHLRICYRGIRLALHLDAAAALAATPNGELDLVIVNATNECESRRRRHAGDIVRIVECTAPECKRYGHGGITD